MCLLLPISTTNTVLLCDIACTVLYPIPIATGWLWMGYILDIRQVHGYAPIGSRIYSGFADICGKG